MLSVVPLVCTITKKRGWKEKSETVEFGSETQRRFFDSSISHFFFKFRVNFISVYCLEFNSTIVMISHLVVVGFIFHSLSFTLSLSRCIVTWWILLFLSFPPVHLVLSNLLKKKSSFSFRAVLFLFRGKLETTFAYGLRIEMQIQELIFFVSSSPAMYTVDFIKQYEYLVDRCVLFSRRIRIFNQNLWVIESTL